MEKYTVKLVSPYLGSIFHQQIIQADRYELATSSSYAPAGAWIFIKNGKTVASFPIQNTIIEIAI